MQKPNREDFSSDYRYTEAMIQYEEYLGKKRMIKTIIGGTIATVVGLTALTVIGGSWYTVDQGNRGVILRNGAITGVAEPGLDFKLPIIDRVVDIDVRSRAKIYENVMAYSRDQQPAGMTISVNYRVPADAVVRVYEEYGSVDNLSSRLLDRQVMDESKNVFGQFNAATAIQERARLVADVQMAIQNAVQGPIIIESVQIENIDFSDAYEQSIEQRMLAEVEVQRVRQNAEREKVQAEIAVIQAQAQADAQVAQATAEAQAIKLRGNAEAEAINARGRALRDNPSLIQLVQAERWDGKLPTTMVPDATVPFVNVGK
jgi:regulator of protease activity HflC (stomatin/prohibitin superfamily)